MILLFILGFIIWYLVGIVSIKWALKCYTIGNGSLYLTIVADPLNKFIYVVFGFFGFINILVLLVEFVENYKKINQYYKNKRKTNKLTLKQLRTKKLKIIKRKSKFRW